MKRLEALIASLAFASTAAAQDAPDSSDDGVEVMTIFGHERQTGRVGGSAHVVDEADLETHERDDIHRILASVPGVYVRGEDGYGLRPNIGLRGASSDRSAKVTLMEDGVLLAPAPYAAPAAYYFPLVTRMSRVEVFKGPAAIRHGPHTIGGALNLTPRAIPSPAAGAIDLSVGRFDAYKTHGWVGGTWGDFGVLVEGVRLTTDGFKELDGGGDAGFEKNEATIDLAWSTHADAGWHRVRLRLGYADEHSDETYLGLTDADFAASPRRRYAGSQLDRMRWTRTQARLDYDATFDLGVELGVTAYRHDFHRSWFKLNRFRGADVREVLDNPDDGQLAVYLAVLRGELDSEGRGQTLLVGDNDRTFVSQGVQARASWTWEGAVIQSRLELSARLHADSIERDHTEDGFLMRSGRLISDGQPTTDTLANRGEAQALAIYLVDELRIGDDLYLTPGGRLERIRTRLVNRLDPAADDGERTDTVLLGGLGAWYQLTDWLGVLGGVHQGFSPVAPGQPAGVEPERAINYEIGARAQHAGLRAELIGFWSDYQNLTVDCTFSSGCDPDALGRQYSAGAVDVYGLEALARYTDRFGAISLDARLSYTHTRSAFASSFVSTSALLGEVEEGDALAYVPAHQLTAGLGLSYGRVGLDLELTHVGEMRDIAGSGSIAAAERIDAHTVVDAAAWFTPTDANRVYLTVSNLADTTYPVARRPFGLRPGMPLDVELGYRHTFGAAW